ncbi:MAG TPA: hypothetical protein VNT52_00960 [Acidimicrobiales bacterium]|nr:hypothetical protein [Acidimicrobiales bacterium]
MTVIKEFLVGLGFEVDDASMAAFNRGVADATLRVAALGAAVTAAAGAVFAGVTKIAGNLDSLSDTAALLNETADAIDRVTYAATLNDSSVDAARASLLALNETAGQAAMGLGRGKQYFDQLGISVKDSNGRLKGASALMAELGEKIKDLDRGQQLGILKGLGIDRTMLATITGGLASVQAEVDEVYKATGLNINQAAADASDYMDEIGRMTFLIGAMGKAVAHKFMGPIREGMARMRKTLLENMPRIIAVVVPIIDLLLRIASAFFSLAGRAASAIGTVLGWLGKANDATNGWAGYILAAAAAWKFLNLSFLASPLGLILSLAAALALLLDDLLTFREGGDSLIDWNSKFGTGLKITLGLLGGAAAAFAAVKTATLAWGAAVAAVNGVLAAARAVVLAFNLVLYANPIGLVIAAIAALIAAGALLIANWDTVKAWFSSFFDWLTSGFDKVASMGRAVAGIFGGGKSAPALTPSPATAATVAGAGGAQTISQKTDIHVHGVKDAEGAARATASAQRGVNADLARNAKGAAR